MGELIVNGIKWSFIISLSLVFVSAINTLLSLVQNFVFGNALGELFGLLSMVLPFNINSVLSAYLTAFNAVLAFLVAKKIYELAGAKIHI